MGGVAVRYRRFLKLLIMKKLLLFLCVLIMASCAVSERKGSGASGTSETLLDISFAMEIAGENTVGVKSILPDGIESKVSDMTLASYGPDGRLTDTRYYDSGFESMPLNVAPNGVSSIYALVNMGDMTGNFPMSEAGALNMEYYVRSYSEVNDKGFPMSGVLKNFSPGRSDKVILVQRLFAKLCVRITHKGLSGYAPSNNYAFNLCNKSLYVRQANSRLLPFSEDGSCALKPADTLAFSDSHQNLNDRNAYQGTQLQGGYGPGPGYVQDTTLVFYVPENVQGKLLPLNVDPFGKVDEEISNLDGKSYTDLCTYLEFNARRENTLGYSGGVMYRYYLGADNTSDFSLVRNSRYDLTLDFTEDGFFAKSWKVTRANDWNDFRILKFIGDSFTIQPGKSVDVMVHYHRAGAENADSQNIPGDWNFVVDDAAASAAGLNCYIDPSGLVAGANGYKDFCVRITAAADAVVGASVPMTVATRDGAISDQAVVTVSASSELVPKWSYCPEYVAQEGVLSFPDAADSDLPLTVSLSDDAKASCVRLSNRSFRIIALETGKVTVSARNSSGSKSFVTELDIKAPCLEVDGDEFLLEPDGETLTAAYRYLDLQGKNLTNVNSLAFDSCLRPVLEAASCFEYDVTSAAISMKIVSLHADGEALGLGRAYDAVLSAAGCREVTPRKMILKIKDPFKGIVQRDYGAVHDYTLFSGNSVETALKSTFQDEIDANRSFEFQTIVPDASSQYITAALEPVWAGDFSNSNGVFKAELNASSGKIRLGYNSFSSATEHSAGLHNLMLYVTNRHSRERIGRSCGTIEVYVHTAIGARSRFGSQKCTYNPYGNETFASVYNTVAGRTVYSSASPSAMVYFMDVSLEWMTDISKVYVWNRMNAAIQSGASWMDAPDIVRPSVADGALDSNTNMLYSVMNGSDSRISVGGEKYGRRSGIGRVLYRALLQPVFSSALTDTDLKVRFFGYQTVTGKGTPSMAPCYTLHDLNKSADMNKNQVISREPYYFSPSSCSLYVDAQGRGYHVIHFLEDISPGTYGWIDLL